ncbi:MAG TPA: YihY/virulence factor BrkB family protein [Xanthobacteraceae bacterium]|nr:YihY/virulence factor BrkB family protein [Xanthobacteraceae bacterium]
MRICYRIAMDAFYSFNADDGWAIASHIALSVLMSMFPFLILVTAIAGFIGSKNLADEVAQLIIAAWPHEVSGGIAGEIHRVLTTARGDILTVGAVFAIYFSSSGVESLRIGLNRAYGLSEKRLWWLLRLESIGYVLISALALLALAFLVVLGPLVFRAAMAYAPWLAPLQRHYDIGRFSVATFVIMIALMILHMWLPAGRRQIEDVWPGIIATLALWLACGFVFGRYLSDFSYTYVRYYAGLASAMTALVFLYFTAWIFIYGGELNAAIARAYPRRHAKAPARTIAQEREQEPEMDGGP